MGSHRVEQLVLVVVKPSFYGRTFLTHLRECQLVDPKPRAVVLNVSITCCITRKPVTHIPPSSPLRLGGVAWSVPTEAHSSTVSGNRCDLPSPEPCSALRPRYNWLWIPARPSDGLGWCPLCMCGRERVIPKVRKGVKLEMSCRDSQVNLHPRAIVHPSGDVREIV